jgi:hypothetical protein
MLIGSVHSRCTIEIINLAGSDDSYLESQEMGSQKKEGRS